MDGGQKEEVEDNNSVPQTSSGVSNGILVKTMASFEPGSEHPDQIAASPDWKHSSFVLSVGSGGRRKKTQGEEGSAPSSYLVLFDTLLPLCNHIAPRRVRVVYRYVRNTELADELGFDKGEVLEAWDGIPGWWNAKNGTGECLTPYFILDGDAIQTEAPSTALTRLGPIVLTHLPPQPFTEIVGRSIASARLNAQPFNRKIREIEPCHA